MGRLNQTKQNKHWTDMMSFSQVDSQGSSPDSAERIPISASIKWKWPNQNTESFVCIHPSWSSFTRPGLHSPVLVESSFTRPGHFALGVASEIVTGAF